MTAGARGYSWESFEPGNVAALRHGARSERTLAPIVAELLASLADAAPWTTAPVFAPTLQSWAHAEARCVVYRRYFDAVGLGLGDDDTPRGLAEWDRAEARAARLREQLGLTPVALAGLLGRLSSIDAPAAASGLEALRQTGAAIRAAAAELPAGES